MHKCIPRRVSFSIEFISMMSSAWNFGFFSWSFRAETDRSQWSFAVRLFFSALNPIACLKKWTSTAMAWSRTCSCYVFRCCSKLIIIHRVRRCTVTRRTVFPRVFEQLWTTFVFIIIFFLSLLYVICAVLQTECKKFNLHFANYHDICFFAKHLYSSAILSVRWTFLFTLTFSASNLNVDLRCVPSDRFDAERKM